MQQLSVIGIEDDVLILESESGERFRVDARSLPERRKPAQPHVARERKARPRDIQALIRGGMTAEEVAAATGEDLDYVRRYETPVLAERTHMLESALSIPVASGDIDPLAGETTFGEALEERLDELHASNRSWASWKESDGGAWVVRLRFTTEGVEHEATWGFEPKKATLTPRGKEAVSLSQHGDAVSALVPRLRAVDEQARPTPPASPPVASSAPAVDQEPGAAPPISQRAGAPRPSAPAFDAARTDGSRPSPVPHERDRTDSAAPGTAPSDAAGPRSSGSDTGRFDSDAFRVERGRGSQHGTGAQAEPRPAEPTRADNPWLRRRTGEVGTQPADVQAAAINRGTTSAQANHTAELLDALRRRRAEREATLQRAEDPSLFEVEAATADEVAPESKPAASVPPTQATGAQTGSLGKKRSARAAMPSWDEIVFGARNDDER